MVHKFPHGSFVKHKKHATMIFQVLDALEEWNSVKDEPSGGPLLYRCMPLSDEETLVKYHERDLVSCPQSEVDAWVASQEEREDEEEGNKPRGWKSEDEVLSELKDLITSQITAEEFIKHLRTTEEGDLPMARALVGLIYVAQESFTEATNRLATFILSEFRPLRTHIGEDHKFLLLPPEGSSFTEFRFSFRNR